MTRESHLAPARGAAALLGFVLALLSGGPVGATSFLTEVHDPFGTNPFTRYVYVCPDCTLAQHEAIDPPDGIEPRPAARTLFSSMSAVRPTIPGVDPGLDLVPEIPGDDYLLTAEVLGGSVIQFKPNFFALTDVARDTRFTFDAGSVVHEAADPDGNLYILWAFDRELDSTIDPAVEGSLADLPLPSGWRYSSRTLSESLVVDSEGLAKVFVQSVSAGSPNLWQRYAVVPEPGTLPLLAVGLVALRGLYSGEGPKRTLRQKQTQGEPRTLARRPVSEPPRHE